MSELDEAMLEHMAYIIYSEKRPFCYKDFLSFKIDEKEFGMMHKTFRNKISQFKKSGEVEDAYYSHLKFYTLKGVKFSKSVTRDHTVVHNNPVYKILQNLSFDKQSIHDIRLKFKVPNIWKIFSLNANFHKNKRSEDIVIPSWSTENAIIRIVVHKTDVISVIIGCSLQPIPLDANGIISFFNILARVEEKLQTILDNSLAINYHGKKNLVPKYQTWTVTMWHFGRDGLEQFNGEKFCITLESFQNILTTIYVKDFKGKNKTRIEKQEYPRTTVLEAIDEKLYEITK